jgi:hypothetical protein
MGAGLEWTTRLNGLPLGFRMSYKMEHKLKSTRAETLNLVCIFSWLLSDENSTTTSHALYDNNDEPPAAAPPKAKAKSRANSPKSQGLDGTAPRPARQMGMALSTKLRTYQKQGH